MRIHYYMVCSRFEALIASHLDPEAFGTYMAVGSRKLSSGHVIFFEIDPAFASHTDQFKVDDIETRCAPHPDGSPKRSKYISVYRVMEFMPPSMCCSLYLTTADGRVMKLEETPYDERKDTATPNLYLELCPLVPMVVSGLPPAEFTRVITNPRNPVHAPRLFFADLLLERDEKGNLAGRLPYPNPLHIQDCLEQLQNDESGKPTKTVFRMPGLHGLFRLIRRGFFLGDQAGLKFYKFPSREHLEVHHRSWWQSASAQ